ncbi:MAG: hypothetical protein HYW48_12605, partial [Deltaproteobacteria bacterium]|nr:hypothetical protein [Deltaproteobacteria bacterium]
DELKGFTLSWLGNGNTILSYYMFIADLQATPEGDGFHLTTRGLPNLGSTCFLNATLQMIYSTPTLREEITRVAGLETDSRKTLATALNEVMIAMPGEENQSVARGKIERVMVAYDLFLEARGAGGLEGLGTFESADTWTLGRDQRAADEFLGKFRQIFNVGVETGEYKVNQATKKVTQKAHLGTTNVVSLAFDRPKELQGMLDEEYFYFQDPYPPGARGQPNERNYVAKRIFAAAGQTGLPELTISLRDRLIPFEGGKNTNPVTFDLETPLRVPFMDADGTMLSQPMRLKAAIVHEEGIFGGGHYVTYVRESDGWKKMSDTTISPIKVDDSFKEAITINSTVLQFERSGLPQQLMASPGIIKDGAQILDARGKPISVFAGQKFQQPEREPKLVEDYTTGTKPRDIEPYFQKSSPGDSPILRKPRQVRSTGVGGIAPFVFGMGVLLIAPLVIYEAELQAEKKKKAPAPGEK